MEIDAEKYGLDRSLRKLSRWFTDSGLRRELKDRQFFMTRGEKRKVKDIRARRRMAKIRQRQQQLEGWG